MYYMGIDRILLAMLWIPVAGFLGARAALCRMRVSHVLHPNSRARLIFKFLIMTTALVLLHIPLHVELLLVRPGLEQWVREIEDGIAPPPPETRHIGFFTILHTDNYANSSVRFFRLGAQGDEGGFAYHMGKEPLSGYYNTGTDGHLGGAWYWWVDD